MVIRHKQFPIVELMRGNVNVCDIQIVTTNKQQ